MGHALAAARRAWEGFWGGLSPTGQGVAFALLVAAMFSCMDATAKALGERYDPLLAVWWRYATQAVGVALIFAPRLRSVARTGRLALQIFRSGLLFLATMLFFTGFSLLPLSEVTAIALLGPLLIVALAAVVLGERVGPWRWLGVLAGIGGGLIIIRPGSGLFDWAALLPVGGALAYAGFNIATRFLGRDEDVWTTFFYTAVVGAVGATWFLPFVWQAPRLEDLHLFLLIGAYGAVGQLALILALQRVQASVMAPFQYTQILWAVGLGWLLFAEIPDGWTVMGGAVIVAAGLFVQWRERLAGGRRPMD